MMANVFTIFFMAVPPEVLPTDSLPAATARRQVHAAVSADTGAYPATRPDRYRRRTRLAGESIVAVFFTNSVVPKRCMAEAPMPPPVA
jgi:hypothetical protein